MFYLNPNVKPKFETLSQDLREIISQRDVQINSLPDLIKVLEDITTEAKS